MTAAFALGVALAAAGSTAARRTSGTVEYATAGRLYLDAGAQDGLAAGQVIGLRRNGRPAGTCKVEQLAARHATCLGNARPGATFALSPPPAPKEYISRLAAPAAPGVIARQRTAVLTAPFEKVEAHDEGAPAAGTSTGSRVALAHATYAATGAGPWQQERVDALLGIALGGGFTLNADLSARRWSRRFEPVGFRPEDPTQLYVWEAAISRRRRSGGLAVSVGRVRPWLVPGATILDGAQAGWRTSGGTEAGIFGGAIPDEVTLAPSFQRGTFGAYWSGQHAGSRDSLLRYFRHELRAAFVSGPESVGRNPPDVPGAPGRFEGEGLAQLWLGHALDVSGSIRVVGGDRRWPDTVENARIDANARLSETLSFTGGFRYDGLRVPELDGSSMRLGGSARRADLSGAWQAAPWLRMSLLSGLTTDLVTQLTRRYAGAEIDFPRLLADAGGLSGGYAEEIGWSSGRNAWIQLLARSRGALQVLARTSWFHTVGQGPTATDDLGAYASVGVQLNRFVALRLSALARTSLSGGKKLSGVGTTHAGTLDVELAGQF